MTLESLAFTLDTTESPADDVRFGWMLFGAGLVLELLVLGVLWRSSRRDARLKPSRYDACPLG